MNIYYVNMYCFVHVRHSVCHEPIYVLINIFRLLAQGFLSILLVLTLSVGELDHGPYIGNMSLGSHGGDEKDCRIGLSS